MDALVELKEEPRTEMDEEGDTKGERLQYRLTRLETLMEAHSLGCIQRQDATDKKLDLFGEQLTAINAKMWVALAGVAGSLFTVVIMLVFKR